MGKIMCPTEAYEASRLVDYLRFKKLPFTHIANETTSGGHKTRRSGTAGAMRVTCPTEAYECERFAGWLRGKNIWFTHVANESSSARDGLRAKKLGQSKGFPDYVLVVGGRMVFVEMKRKRGGRVSPEQKAWLAALSAVSPTAVCRGFEEAKIFVEQFL